MIPPKFIVENCVSTMKENTEDYERILLEDFI